MSDNKISIIPDNAITEIVQKVYDDVGHQTLKEIGNIGEGIMKFVALPFKFLGLTADQIEEKYRKFIKNSIRSVPIEKRTTPAKYVIAPLMDDVKYYFDEGTIYKMYSELLGSAINSEKCSKVHPLHVQLLRQMAPLDADIFNDCFHDDDSCLFIATHNHHKTLDKESNQMFLVALKNKKVSEYKYDWLTVRRSFDIMESINLIEEECFYNPDYIKKVYDDFHKNINKYISKDYEHITCETISYSLNFAGQIFRDMCIKK